MSGAHLFTSGRHFNKQRIQYGTQKLSINRTDMQFELQIDKNARLLSKYVPHIPTVAGINE